MSSPSLNQTSPESIDYAREGPLQIITNALPVLIGYIDREETYRFNNKLYEEWFGYSQAELRGKHVREVWGEKAYTQLHPYLLSAYQGKTVTFESEVTYAQGGPRFIQATYIPQFGEFREVVGVITLVADITEQQKVIREKARLALQVDMQRRRLSDIISSVPGVVWEAVGVPNLKTQQINFVSDYVETMLGYTVEEWLATPNFWLTIVHPDDQKRAGEEGTAIFLGKRKGISEFRWVAKDGRVIWVEAQSTVIYDDDGNPIGMRGVTMDITYRKQAEQRMWEANEELKRLNQLKSDFTAVVSHELRTPLSVMKEAINLTLEGIEGPVTEAQVETLGLAKANVDRLARLINNVLDFSRMESSKWSMIIEKTNMTALMTEVYTMMKIAARKKELHCVLELPPQPVFAICDADKIKQVLINLIHNAIKFTPPKGTITCRMMTSNSNIKFEVEDTGIGIHEKDKALIFEMYSQALSDNRRHAGGAGVGLAVCKQIVEKHHGTITVESAYGKGSRFTVTLPCGTPFLME